MDCFWWYLNVHSINLFWQFHLLSCKRRKSGSEMGLVSSSLCAGERVHDQLRCMKRLEARRLRLETVNLTI